LRPRRWRSSVWRVAILATALWVPGTLYPPSDVAHAVFRIAVCLAACGTLALPRGRLVRWGLVAWGLGITASVILAADPWRAFWSTHNRQEGAWQAAHYLALVLVLAAVPREKVVRWVAVAALGAAAWGVAPLGWVNGWLAGSTGNPLYLAPLLIVGVWGAWRASISMVSESSLPGRCLSGHSVPMEQRALGSSRQPWAGPAKRVTDRTFWRALAALLALAAVATGSKGVAVAVIAAGGAWLLAKAPRVALAGAVLLALGIWAVPIPASGLIRLELGRVALHGIWAEPWGWGAEGFPYVWDTFWRGVAPTGEAWHDRAHNLLLDRAIEWGIVGLIGWSMVVIAAWRRAELPERMALAAWLGFHLTMFEMMWGAVGFAALLGYVLHRRPMLTPKVTGRVLATVALVVGAAQLAQSNAAARAATMPEMEAAIELWSPVGGDVVELYLKAPQTRATLDWAAERVETRSSHATQQAMLLAVWDRQYCADLRLAAPTRPDVRELCRNKP
jgi:hypothetical protein